MENKVGDNVPSQKHLDSLLATLTKVIDELKAFCITLQAEERQSTLKPLKGADALVMKAHELATRYGVAVKNVPLDGMMNDLKLAKQLQPFDSLLQLGAQMAADTNLQAKSEYWSAYLAYYGALSQAADHDAALAAELKELQEAMKTARRRRAPEGGGGGAGAGAGGGATGG